MPPVAHSYQSPIALTLASLLVTACGSSSGTPAPEPEPQTNTPPVFSSPTSASVPENRVETGLTVQASDADGDGISYSIVSESTDAALFSIDPATGSLSFRDAPDFERPADEDGDNDYALAVRADDGAGGTTDAALTITVTDVEQSARFVRVGSGLPQPIYLTGLGDGSDRVLVYSRGGRIDILDPGTGTVEATPFADLEDSVGDELSGEGGLLGAAFAPDFATSRALYVNVTNNDGDTEIRRYTLEADRDDRLDPASETLVLRIDQPLSNHNAGWIGFAGDGMLIIPTGDGGGGGDPLENAQDTQSLLGKVLRIDVGGDDFPADDTANYAIPSGNAFANAADGRAEIFATGLRNPFRASFDSATGDLLIGDVGQNAAEEISRLSFDAPGTNFGWNVREGTRAFRGMSADTLTDPVAEYPHGSGPFEGRSVAGGYVYRGPVEALQGQYVFGDFVSANIWSVPADDLVTGETVSNLDFTRQTDALAPTDGSATQLTSFGLDDAGNLYLLSLGGDVFRLEADE